MKFRLLCEADIESVLAAENVLHPFPWTRGNFADSLAAGHGLWVALEEDILVAYAVTQQVLDEMHLLNISVLPDRQRNGLGGTLLRHLLDTARAAGAKCMLLEVRQGNMAAQRLYRKLDFNEIGRRKAYYPAAAGREDAIVMARNL